MGEGVSKIIIPHRLGFKPKDIIITAAIPDYNAGANAHPSIKLLFDDKDFNDKTIAIEVDQPCTIRMFAGSYEEIKR